MESVAVLQMGTMKLLLKTLEQGQKKKESNQKKKATKKTGFKAWGE